MSDRQKKYLDTYRRYSKEYQRRVQKNKTITIRIGKHAGRVISARMQASLNTSTGNVAVTNALWHWGYTIYASAAPEEAMSA